MWARSQMNQWSQEAALVSEEKKKKDCSQSAGTKKDEVVSLSSSDSSPWMMEKVETLRKLSGVLSSLVSDSEK